MLRKGTTSMKYMLCLALLILTGFQQSVPLKERVKSYRNSKKFSVEYDRFKDRTSIDVGDFWVKGLQMSVTLSFKGQEPRESVDQVFFFFRGPKARVYDSAFIIIDGDRFELREVTQVSRGIISGTQPSAMLTMQRDLFEKLATSKIAEMQIGRAEIKFEDEHFQAFRDLISLVSVTP